MRWWHPGERGQMIQPKVKENLDRLVERDDREAFIPAAPRPLQSVEPRVCAHCGMDENADPRQWPEWGTFSCADCGEVKFKREWPDLLAMRLHHLIVHRSYDGKFDNPEQEAQVRVLLSELACADRPRVLPRRLTPGWRAEGSKDMTAR